jgi:molybdopterin synthase catalytic subunit
MSVRVQNEDFDVGIELASMRIVDGMHGEKNKTIGAIVNFIGLVRDINDGDHIQTLTLEHYPEMTQKALEKIETEAKARWHVIESRIIHRIGTLQPSDQIVFVAVASTHRNDAFSACEFIMDFLKTQAPFWKKEVTNQGTRWVEAKISDDEAQKRWLTR